MTGLILKFLVFLLLLAGCVNTTPANEVPTTSMEVQPTEEMIISSTPGFSPTSSPTYTPTITEAPASTVQPTRTSYPAILLPTLALPTLAFTPPPQPAALSGVIQFYKPGPMSQIISPIRFYGYAVPGYNHKGLIELFGEDGSLKNSEILQLNTDYKWAFFSWSLDFRARGAGELGRLSLSTRDNYDRLTAIRSVRVFLQNEGQEIINPAEAMVERLVLESPLAGKRITGGHLLVTGDMQAYNEEPLIIDLVTMDGAVIGSQLVPVPPGEGGGYFRFRIDIPYSVRSTTTVLLTIRQPDDIIPGIIYLYSQENTLSP